jgi:hypothetical protein
MLEMSPQRTQRDQREISRNPINGTQGFKINAINLTSYLDYLSLDGES